MAPERKGQVSGEAEARPEEGVGAGGRADKVMGLFICDPNKVSFGWGVGRGCRDLDRDGGVLL